MRDPAPLVSVLMSTHNDDPYIDLALRSIAQQTFTDFEVLLIDDGSSPEYVTRLRQLAVDPRIRLFTQPNQGLTRTLIQYTPLARGRYIARHDADDVSHPERLRRQVEYMEQHPSCALLGTNATIIDEAGTRVRRTAFATTSQDLKRLLPTQNPFVHGSVLLRTSCVHAVGGYDPRYAVMQDYELWIRLAGRYDVANLEQPYYQYRVHPRAISHRRAEEQQRMIAQARHEHYQASTLEHA